MRYEDLAAAPEETMREVCRFLEVEFDRQMLKRRSKADLPPVHAQLDNKEHQAWRLAHIERAREEVSADSITRWRSELSPAEIDAIECEPRWETTP